MLYKSVNEKKLEFYQNKRTLTKENRFKQIHIFQLRAKRSRSSFILMYPRTFICRNAETQNTEKPKKERTKRQKQKKQPNTAYKTRVALAPFL